MRRRFCCSLLLAGSVACTSPAISAWTPEGVLIDTFRPDTRLIEMVPDGTGGILAPVLYRPSHNSSEWGTSVSRVTTDGTKLWSWNPWVRFIAPDGAGGAFGLSGYNTTLRLYHVLANGSNDALYSASGVPVVTMPDEGFTARLASDESGGAYVLAAGTAMTVWRYAQGAPAPGWPETGVEILPPAPGPLTTQGYPDFPSVQMIPDGSNGLIIVASDAGGTRLNGTLKAFRVLPDGSVAWTRFPALTDPAKSALPMSLIHSGPWFYCLSLAYSDTTELFEIRLQCMSITTGIRRTGWPADGIPVAQGRPDSLAVAMTSDGGDAVYVAWAVGSTLRGVRFTGAGALAPGWPQQGIDLLPAGAVPALAMDFSLSSVAAGFAITATYDRVITLWTDNRDWTRPAVLARWLLPDGTVDPAQPVSGRAASPTLSPYGHLLGTMSDGNRGAYVSWSSALPASNLDSRVTWLSYWTPWVGVSDPIFGSGGASLRAWPNPARDHLELEIPASPNGPARVELVDVAGHRVRSAETHGNAQTVRFDDLDRLPAGVYFLQVTQGGAARSLRLALVR